MDHEAVKTMFARSEFQKAPRTHLDSQSTLIALLHRDSSHSLLCELGDSFPGNRLNNELATRLKQQKQELRFIRDRPLAVRDTARSKAGRFESFALLCQVDKQIHVVQTSGLGLWPFRALLAHRLL